MNRTFKLVLVCSGIFASGLVAGGFITHHHMQSRMPSRRPNADGFGPSQMQKFSEALSLTEEQKAKISPIIATASDELRRMRRESFKAGGAVIEQMEAQVAELLTEPQKVLLAELQAEQRERRNQWMAERQKRAEQRGEGGETTSTPPPSPPPEPPPSTP